MLPGEQHRRLQAEAPDDAPLPGLEDDDPANLPMFSLATSCPLKYAPSATIKELYKSENFGVSNLRATVEMTQETTYSNNFRANDPTTWAPGSTRLNYTVEIVPNAGKKAPTTLRAQLHSRACFSALDQDTVYLRDESNNKSDVEAELTLNPDTHQGTSSTVLDFLVDYDSTQALVVYDGTEQVACCNLIPPFPDFPTEWRSTVEANIVNQGYTYVQRETYSQARNKVRVDLHAYDADIVMIQDYDAKETTLVYPSNTTFPNGVCETREFIPSMSNFVDDEGGSVYGTGNFLMFSGTENDESSKPVFEPGHVSARGIPCESWYRKVTNKAVNSSFDVQFLFPVNQWLVAREDYHRMLKQIVVTGTMDGEEIEHLYSYINFRPYIAPDEAFDVCVLAPKGESCGCEDRVITVPMTERAIQFNEDGSSVTIQRVKSVASERLNNQTAAAIAAAAVTQAEETCPGEKDFTKAQGKWYAMWVMVGIALGALLTWLVALCCSRRGDRTSSAKLKERPFIIGRQQGSHGGPSSYI